MPDGLQAGEATTVANVPSARETRSLRWSLIILGLLLAVAVVPGVFIVDEPNYLSTVVGLRQGSWMIPATVGLPPSRELVAFDPEDQSRMISSTPVTSLAPPLYAVIAWPFSWSGWTSLFLLNVLSFVVIAWCVYTAVRDQGGTASSGVIGVLTFILGGFSIEYALGMWPHMVSVALTSCAFLLTLRGLDGGSAWLITMAGLLVGVSVGVREQSIVIVAGLGAAVLTFARPRWKLTSSFFAGAAIPLVLIAAINGHRLGVFSPVPKAGAYATDVQKSLGPTAQLGDNPLEVWWAKVVDFRVHPLFTDSRKERLFRKEAMTGVPLVGEGVVKKALLQSAPWAAFALVAIVIGWRRTKRTPTLSSRALGTSAWIIAPVMIVIAMAGYGRSDGLAYNQRYFLELIPVCAMVTGIAVGSTAPWRLFLAAVAGAITFLLLPLALIEAPHRYAVIAILPLVLAAGCAAVGLLSPAHRRGRLIAVLIGIAVGWSFLIHVVDDVRASRDRRSGSLEVLRAVEPHIARGSALFAYGGGRDAVSPLMLSHDVLLLDAWADQGETSVRLLDAIQARGQRTFVRTDGFPQHLLASMTTGRRVVRLRDAFPQLIEIVPPQ